MSHLFLHFIKLLYTEMSQLRCKCPQDFFRRDIGLLKKLLLLSFCTLFGKFVAFRQQSLRRVIRTDFCMSIGTLWRDFPEKILISFIQFWTFTAKLSAFCRKVLGSAAVLSNCILLVCRTCWVESFLIERSGFCWITSGKERKGIGFLSNFSNGVVKIALSFSKRSFWGKPFFWKKSNLFNIFGQWAESF